MKTWSPIALITICLISQSVGGASESPSRPLCVGTASAWDYVATSEDLDNTCSLGCALGWDVSASSESDGHSVKALDDYSIDSCWIPDEEVHSRVYFSFPKENFPDGYTRIRFDGFYLLSGCGAGSTYAFPRILRILLNDDFLCEVTAINTTLPQTLTIPNVYLSPGDVVIAEIYDVYPGSQIHRPAITALIPTGAH